MTTIDRAAAWRIQKPVARAALLIMASVGLAGCETGNSLFANNGETTPSAQVTDAAPPPGTAQRSKIAVAAIVGPPDATSRALQSQIASALERQRITVAKAPADPSEYTLRGYVVSAREKASTKVSYIWDLTDPAGKRVNRITGEEISTGAGAGKDTWSAVTPQVVDQIANKSANSISAWLNGQGAPATGAPAAGVPVASAGRTSDAYSPNTPVTQTAAVAPAAATPAAVSPTTGSIGREGPVLAAVPNVTGAPGDGGMALTSAIQRELTKNGVSLSSGSATAYKVEGKVSVGPVADGKQPVSIDWHVKDPAGKKLGTVTQKNEVPQGSLDGSWGKTADAAAAAAAQGIIKLLPKSAN